MQNFVFINGQITEECNAKISIFDRGLLFADAIYEVTAVIDKKLLDFAKHMERLQNSINKLSIQYIVDREALYNVHKQLIELNQIHEGSIYCQISRGQGERDFIYKAEMVPNIFIFSKQQRINKKFSELTPLKILSRPDGRWCRRDIKTVQLLYSSMSKTNAQQQGAHDTLFYDESGYVTECSSSNFHIITKDNKLITPPLSTSLLPGITRARVLKIAPELGYTVEERTIKVPEIFELASAAFITSATNLLMPIKEIDGRIITTDYGPIQELRNRYLAMTPYD